MFTLIEGFYKSYAFTETLEEFEGLQIWYMFPIRRDSYSYSHR
jgi:hypothetical protein